MVAIRKMRTFGVRLIALFLLAVVTTTGCTVSEPIYQWGNYEPILTTTYSTPGELDPGAEINLLTEDVERARAEGSKVPPGVHAHLGYLYYTQGNRAAAKQHFLTEKELFPESKVFIDGILKRLARKAK